MPYLSKQVISQYLHTECRRQLRLNLSPDTAAFRRERSAHGMPPVQPPRPGLEQFAQAGERWQAEKLEDLVKVFGAATVAGASNAPAPPGAIRFGATPLKQLLGAARPGLFLVEGEYSVEPISEHALSIAALRGVHGLRYAAVRPDLIMVLDPGTYSSYVTPAGDVGPLPTNDRRLQLRVIDIKLTSEPSAGYFAEVAYYTIILAGWLIAEGLDDRYVAVPDGAVWPGSHEASRLWLTHQESLKNGAAATRQTLLKALEEDLEEVPFEVFSLHLKRFLREELPAVLAAPSWRALDWHVDNRCRGCEYLGEAGRPQHPPHPDHCLPMADQQRHLSRVAFISRGASAALRDRAITDVAALARLTPQDPAFDGHQSLRTSRAVVAGRAASLHTGHASIVAGSATSAVMPRWADLRIYLSADFDASSAITFAFGLEAFYSGVPAQGGARVSQPWGPQAFIVDQRSLAAEEREYLAFLKAIHDRLDAARSVNPDSTVQFYLWDSLQYGHLVRVAGRHLQAILQNRALNYLAWLFPPEDLLPNPVLMTRKSPITIVREVVRSSVAAPVPHYYTLLEVAANYHADAIRVASIHPLFQDRLSDQIPSERAHEIWGRSVTPPWHRQMTILAETVEKRLGALRAVVRRLEDDLKQTLHDAAPTIRSITPPRRQNRLSSDGQLWFAFAKLNEALEELECHQVRAMPAYEREARFHSARLDRRLTASWEQAAFARLGLAPAPGRRIYEMRPGSRDVKVKEGDFGLALAPEQEPGFLDRKLLSVTSGTPLEPQGPQRFSLRMEDVLGVTVRALDRDAGLIVVDPSPRWPTMIDDLEAAGLVNLSEAAILDPVHHDFFTRKLLAALTAIGNPPSAGQRPLVLRATGQLGGAGSRPSPPSPPAEVLWDAPAMHATQVPRNLGPMQATLQEADFSLNTTQWQAWREALSRRLALIWGPPGTGKSRTCRAIVDGAVIEAHQRGGGIRVLICASTYTALDNVLSDIAADLQGFLSPGAGDVYRLRSYLQPAPPQSVGVADCPVNQFAPSPMVLGLRQRLGQPSVITVVGAPPEQVHNLLVAQNGSAQQELFDLVLIDEASQMDVAHAILPFAALAGGGSVVLAGDPKQLPPIHAAEPPLGLEAMVASVYEFFRAFHQIPDVMLEENYRSNETLVAFARHGGYRPSLTSYSPDLRLNFLAPQSGQRPTTWPASLHWTPEWLALIDPAAPATCLVYPNGKSSQWNQFEADAIAALACLLWLSRIENRLRNERDPVTGGILAGADFPYSPQAFWERAIGVVTPHRAQQGLITSRLQQVFAPAGIQPAIIRAAVDTVERFQGQQRDVIISSFALGDPDLIRDEEEFLFSFNRFNVMASRARAKLIVLVSQEIIDHIASDIEIVRASWLLKSFAEVFCDRARPVTLGFLERNREQQVSGLLRWRV